MAGPTTRDDIAQEISTGSALETNSQNMGTATFNALYNAEKIGMENDMASGAVGIYEKQRAISGPQSYNQTPPTAIDYQTERLYPQEYFPSGEKSNMMGSYSGSIVGNNQIYVSGNVREPFSIRDRRQRNIAQAKEKEAQRRKEFMALVKANGAEQYNRKINDMKFSMMEKALSENGYDIDEFMTYDSPKSLEFWRQMNDIDFFAEETVRVNAWADTILEQANAGDGTTYVSEKDREAAYAWKAGSMNIADFYENNDSFTSMKNRLQSWTNLRGALKDFNPVLDQMFLKAAEDGTLFDGVDATAIDNWSKMAEAGDQQLWTSEAIKFIPQERILAMAKEFKKTGNFVQTEAEIADYMRAYIGNGQITMDKAILDKSRGRGTTINVKTQVNDGDGDRTTKNPNPMMSMFAESIYDKNGAVRENMNTMMQNINNIDDSLPVEKKQQLIIDQFNGFLPSANWQFNKNGELFGEYKVGPNVLDQDTEIPLSANIKNYRYINTNGEIKFGNNPGVANNAIYDENGKPRASVTAKPVTIAVGFENAKAGRAVTMDELLAGAVSEDSAYLVATVVYQPYKTVTPNPQKPEETYLELDNSSGFISRTYDLRKMPERTSVDEIIEGAQKYDMQNQKSNNATKKSPTAVTTVAGFSNGK